MLQIQMASLYLTGEYKCIASDGHSSLERVFHLEVCSGEYYPYQSLPHARRAVTSTNKNLDDTVLGISAQTAVIIEAYEEKGTWGNHYLRGTYPPGSNFQMT